MNAISQFCDVYCHTGFDLALRSSVILFFAAVLAYVLRFSSSSTRHLIWSAALVGVLLTPAISLVSPVRLAVPISQLGSQLGPAHDSEPATLSTQPLRPDVDMVASAAAEIAASRAAEEVEPTRHRQAHNHTTVQPITAVSVRTHDLNWRVLIVGIWLVGAVAFSLPLLLGSLSLQRLRYSSVPLTDEIEFELRRLTSDFPGGRRVIGLLSALRTMPMTWGVLRPTILLPVDAVDWPVARVRLVLQHELAHIRRRDCLLQMIGQIVRALHWFNPLAWWSLSQLRLEQEKACDDAVLNTGTHADEYAAELLSVSARLSHFSWDASVALAMSRVTRLEQRLKAILNMNNNRRPLSIRTVAAGLTVLGSLVFAVAIIQLHEVQGAPPAPGAVAISNEAAAQIKAAKQADTKNNTGTNAEKNTEKNTGAKEAAGAVANPPGGPASARLSAAAKTIESHSLINVNASALSEAGIRGMLETLKDPYSMFLSEDELKSLYQQLEGELVGIGAALKKEGDAPIVVELLIPNSPALLGGLKVGDTIVAVDGKPAEKLVDTVKAIRGTAGTEVALKIIRADKTETVLTLKRGQVRLSAVKGISISEQGQWQHWLDTERKVAYVLLAEFNASAATDLKSTLKSLTEQGLKGLVLDLRGNPGGQLNVACGVAELFLKNSLIVELRGRSEDQNVSFRAPATAEFPDLPLVLVIDRYTASAGEVLAAALKENDRALPIGERTFGKGSVQSIIPLDNTAIRLTTAQMLTPKGRQWSRQPDSQEWGVDPRDGYFIPLTAEQRAARQAKRVMLEKGSLQPKGPLTMEVVQQELSDPALASALKSMQAKITSGEFAKTGQPLADQQVQLARQAEVRTKRDELRKQVEQLDRELGETRFRLEGQQ